MNFLILNSFDGTQASWKSPPCHCEMWEAFQFNLIYSSDSRGNCRVAVYGRIINAAPVIVSGVAVDIYISNSGQIFIIFI